MKSRKTKLKLRNILKEKIFLFFLPINVYKETEMNARGSVTEERYMKQNCENTPSKY